MRVYVKLCLVRRKPTWSYFVQFFARSVGHLYQRRQLQCHETKSELASTRREEAISLSIWNFCTSCWLSWGKLWCLGSFAQEVEYCELLLN
jgi:hypothetical protein